VQPDGQSRRQKVLFIAEAVTLAHVARASVLAGTLDPTRFDVHTAWDSRYNHLLGQLPFTMHSVHTMASAQFLDRLRRGRPMHDAGTLRRYVADDLELMRRVQPDLVVGDFRLSLAVSAPVARVRHIAVANAYWSPFGHQDFIFPEYDYPLSAVIGRTAARGLFRVVLPMGFAMHTKPLNRVRREHGLGDIGRDIRTMYTLGDYTAYADVPELVPLEGLPASHRHVGAVLWSPAVPQPGWWDELPSDRPLVYVTFGSSGEQQMLPVVLDALSGLPVWVMAATAGRSQLGSIPANARVADFLPGTAAAARARLVICNGGSPTTSQAVAAGVPVLGLVSNNMDQQLNMQYVKRAGAGEILQASRISVSAVRTAVERLLGSTSHLTAARRLCAAHQAHRVEEQFPRLVAEALQTS
jgi:UDP:flavonoid glycosyltransferase YjiC (YdhE family)